MMSQIQVTAPNGVVWTRRPGSRSTEGELLRALETVGSLGDLERRWNLWKDGEADRLSDQAMRVLLADWDNGAPSSTEEAAKAAAKKYMANFDRKIARAKKRREALAAKHYDQDRERLRLQLLRTESDIAFFGHVADAPATPAQHEDALRRIAQRRTEADELRGQLGCDPEKVFDRSGFLPAERRERHLREHRDYWRHPALREFAETKQRARFNTLLSMPMPSPQEMCSECQAPAYWHDYDLSLCLFVQPPPAGSREEKLSNLMPGWWNRCPACTAYKVRHVWGGTHALPDFDGDQWVAMLSPLLRAIFSPPQPKSAKPTAPRSNKPTPASLKRRIREAEREAEWLRKELAAMEQTEEER